MKTIKAHGIGADADVSGRYVVSVRGEALHTESSVIAFPPYETYGLLYPRIWGSYIAGYAHDSDKAWLHDGARWALLDRAFGINAVAFDVSNPERAFVLVCETSQYGAAYQLPHLVGQDIITNGGSLGIRWVKSDGTIVTAESTYADPARGLYEYTDYGDMAIGQGRKPGQGCVVRFADDGILRLLEPGQVRQVRVDRDGDRFAISMVRQDTDEAVIYWLTLEELRALPAVEEPVVTLPACPDLSGRRLWLGYFFAISDRPGYGDNLAAPGNCTLVHTDAEAARSPWPYFAPVGVADGPRKIGAWSSTPEPPTGGLHILDYGHATPPHDPIVGIRWQGVECYADWRGETADDVRRRVGAWLTRHHVPTILIGQSYSRNGEETRRQVLADLQAIPLWLAQEFPHVEGILWFSDARFEGTRSHQDGPLWRQVHARAAAQVLAPAIDPVPVPTPPEVSMPDVITSSNGQYRAVMQNDGNFVIYRKDGSVVWASGSNEAPPEPSPLPLAPAE